MRILIVDDHPLTCSGLKLLLQAAYPETMIVPVHTAKAALQELASGPAFDWIFLDIGLPDDPDHQLLIQLRDSETASKTVLISAQMRPDMVHDALRLGMRGFIPKSADPAMVLEGVRTIFNGEIYVPPDFYAAVPSQIPVPPELRPLSQRQQQVLALLLKGCPNKVIARELDLTVNTVKEYVSVLLKLHGVASRLELILKIVHT